MRLRLDGVASADVAAAWPAVRPFLARALAEGAGHLDADDVRTACLSGAMQLWRLGEADGRPCGALVTELADYPRLRVCRLVLAAAEDGRRAAWLGFLPAIEAWAAARGAARMEAWGRPGWARLVPSARARVALEWTIDGRGGGAWQPAAAADRPR